MNSHDDQWRTDALAEYARTRSVDLRNEIVEEFAALAEYFAKRYLDRGVERDDLRQVAMMALVHSVERFDPEVGVKFSTFAGRTIDGELKKHFRDKTWAVRVPRSLKERSALINQHREALTKQNDRPPTVPELAEAAGLTVDEVIEGLDAGTAYRPKSIDAARTDDEQESLGRSMGGMDPAFARTEMQMAVASIIGELEPRDQEIIRLRFFDELSQREIADRVGISQMHVSRLLRSALEELRTLLRG